jgi:signal transduction histidine kinase
VNNLMQTPLLGSDKSPPSEAQLAACPACAEAHHKHAVHFYDDEVSLCDTVGQFVSTGLLAGERVLVIATAGHRESILERLDQDLVASALRGGQLALMDARLMLSKFMLGSMPDAQLFKTLFSGIVASVAARPPGVQMRAFGEMVDLLWRDGNSKAALRLEELWNEVVELHGFSLLCAYVRGNFYSEVDAAHFLELCGLHDHFAGGKEHAPLESAQDPLAELSSLQERASLLESEVNYRKEIERVLREALKHKDRVECELRASLEREQAARLQAQANDAFKEVFLGILGHDLRNPLNTILTTSRLMTMRRELASDSQKRLDRVVASGLRMQRMIEQILDMARDRLVNGISVRPSAAQDIVPLISRIIDEIRLARPEFTIELHDQGPCRASVDPDRFEQVVSNLLGNAVTHGDPEEPIVIRVTERGDLVSLSVRNYGPPIDPQALPLLFDPFRRVRKGEGHSEGLGLGLYISERIIKAHGGKIEVQSSAENGTHFEAVFPRLGAEPRD